MVIPLAVVLWGINMRYIDSTHTYLNDDGVIIPSVTQLISWKFGSGYEDVPEDVLKAKAKYGTRIHALVEEYCKQGKNQPYRNPVEAMSMVAYIDIASKLPKVVANEQIVCFDNRLAGTLDLLYEDGTIGDIKTYYNLDDNAMFKIKWQISLYLFCKYGKDMKNYNNNHLIYLPRSMKNYGHYDINDIHTYDDCLSLLEEYENAHEVDLEF